MNRTRKFVTGVWGAVLAALVIVTLRGVTCSPLLSFISLVAGVAGCVVAFCVITWRWASTDEGKLSRMGVLGNIRVDVSRADALKRASYDWLNTTLIAGEALGDGSASGVELFAKKPHIPTPLGK